MKPVAIINCTGGNVRSVLNAFSIIGTNPYLVRDKNDLETAELIVLPGVGSFRTGMLGLNSSGLIPHLKNQIYNEQKPLLGICLGMQLLCTSSEENDSIHGLGWIDAKVEKLKPPKNGYPVPHVGWDDVDWSDDSVLRPKKRPLSSCFYFVHSYAVLNKPVDAHVECTTDYGQTIISGFRRNNIYGLQFHPEKSQDEGLDVLDQWISLT